MKQLNEQIEELSLIQFNEAEHKRLEEKYQDVTKTEALQGLNNFSRLSMNVGQAFSIILGFGLCLMCIEWLPKIALFAGAVSFFLLCFIEYGKRWNLSKLNKYRIINKKKKQKHKINLNGYRFAAILFVGASMFLSFSYSPYVISYAVKAKNLVSLDSIKADYSSKASLASVHWSTLKQQYLDKAYQIHKNNQWKGVTVKDARDEQLLMEQKSSEMQDSLNSNLSYLLRQKDKEIHQANKTNESIIKNHKNWCNSFALFCASLAILVDLLLMIAARFCSNFDEMKIIEGRSRKEILDSLGQEQRKEQRTDFKEKKKERTKEKAKKQEAENQQEASSEIGFKKHQEGDIVKEKEKEFVLVEMKKGKKKGSLIKKSKTDLKNLINNQSNPDRIEHLKGLLQKFS